MRNPIKSLRESSDSTITQFSIALGVSPALISQLERGTVKSSPRVFEALKLFGYDADSIFREYEEFRKAARLAEKAKLQINPRKSSPEIQQMEIPVDD